MKIIVVGFGFMGQTHCGNLLNIPGVELAGIVDPVDPAERLRTVKGNLQTVSLKENDIADIPHYTTLSEALDAARPQATVICLPTFLHESGTLEALRHDQHVFVEKPFALTDGECRNMLTLAEQKKRVLAVGYVVRKVPEYAFLRDTVASGRLGALKFLQLRRITGIPNWGNWGDPKTVEAVGGSLFDLVSHDIDFARYILGEPEKISVDRHLCREFNGNYTGASLHYAGCRVALEGGFVTPPGFPFASSYRAFFEKGTLTGDSDGNCREYDEFGNARDISLERSDPYFAEMSSFIQAIRGEGEVVCCGSDAAGTVACCNEIRRLAAQEI